MKVWQVVLTVLVVSTTALAVDIPASSSVGPVPGTPGDGLSGRYWQLAPVQISPTDNALKDFAPDYMANNAPTSTFISTILNYTGDDLTPIGTWLGPDAGSIVGGDPAVNNLDDGMFAFDGYIAVSAPGTIDYSSGSDDGSIVTIGGVTVIDNDSGHGAPGPAPDGSATFAAAGLYPVEITYFNGDWTDDAGAHGGANIAWRQGPVDTGPIVATSVLYTVPEPSALALLGLGAFGWLMSARRRRK